MISTLEAELGVIRQDYDKLLEVVSQILSQTN